MLTNSHFLQDKKQARKCLTIKHLRVYRY